MVRVIKYPRLNHPSCPGASAREPMLAEQCSIAVKLILSERNRMKEYGCDSVALWGESSHFKPGFAPEDCDVCVRKIVWMLCGLVRVILRIAYALNAMFSVFWSGRT